MVTLTVKQSAQFWASFWPRTTHTGHILGTVPNSKFVFSSPLTAFSLPSHQQAVDLELNGFKRGRSRECHTVHAKVSCKARAICRAIVVVAAGSIPGPVCGYCSDGVNKGMRLYSSARSAHLAGCFNPKRIRAYWELGDLQWEWQSVTSMGGVPRSYCDILYE